MALVQWLTRIRRPSAARRQRFCPGSGHRRLTRRWNLEPLEARLCLSGDRIFAAESLSSPGLIFEVTDGQHAEFARITSDGVQGALSVSPDGRLLDIAASFGGSLWDISSGGDHTQDTPLASNLFPASAAGVGEMTFDAAGNIYISDSDHGAQPIAVVASDGSVSYLADASGNLALFNNARGLAVLNNVLYIVEGATGKILAYDLTTGEVSDFATGFAPGNSGDAGSLAVDQRGELLLIWSVGQGYGLYDITAGGDFTGQAPLVPVASPFHVDGNEIAVDSANSVYLTTGVSGPGRVDVSQFDGQNFSPFMTYATGFSDTDLVAVLPGPCAAGSGTNGPPPPFRPSAHSVLDDVAVTLVHADSKPTSSTVQGLSPERPARAQAALPLAPALLVGPNGSPLPNSLDEGYTLDALLTAYHKDNHPMDADRWDTFGPGVTRAFPSMTEG